MTGRYVVRYGMQYDVITPGAPWGIPVTEKVRLFHEVTLERTREIICLWFDWSSQTPQNT